MLFRSTAVGFSVLKGEDTLSPQIENWLKEFSVTQKNWELKTQFHFGGYAKTTPSLLAFITEMQLQHNLPLDSVYTGKMFAGIFELISKEYFFSGSRILAIHTGGLPLLD